MKSIRMVAVSGLTRRRFIAGLGAGSAAAASAVAPQAQNVEIRFVTDHTAGPRGKAMQWGMGRFAELRPEIFVKLEPTGSLIDSLALQFAAGTAPHVALLSQSDFLRFHADGAFTNIDDVLPKLNVDKSEYYFLPDAYTFNNTDHSFP